MSNTKEKVNRCLNFVFENGTKSEFEKTCLLFAKYKVLNDDLKNIVESQKALKKLKNCSAKTHQLYANLFSPFMGSTKSESNTEIQIMLNVNRIAINELEEKKTIVLSKMYKTKKWLK